MTPIEELQAATQRVADAFAAKDAEIATLTSQLAASNAAIDAANTALNALVPPPADTTGTLDLSSVAAAPVGSQAIA